MGCFIGCFGFSSKRKRRKPANRVQPGDHGFGSYEPLNSTSTVLDITGEPINSDSVLSKKHKEPLNCKIRKKVSFNLNLQSYEPISKEESTDYFWESEEEEKKVGISKETAKEGQSPSRSDGDSIATIMVSYPSNYRYRNCVDCYDEEDEIAYEESDLDNDDDGDSDEDEDDDSGGDIDDARISQEELSEKFMSLSVSSNKRDSLTEFAEEKSENMILNEGGLKSLGMNRNARARSQYVYSVLNPVENLSQWKAVKAKGMPPVKRQRKENIAALDQQARKPTPEIAVDASLSNWLFSADSCQSRATSITKSNNILVDAISSKKNSIEDMPILDNINLEASQQINCSNPLYNRLINLG